MPFSLFSFEEKNKKYHKRQQSYFVSLLLAIKKLLFQSSGLDANPWDLPDIVVVERTMLCCLKWKNIDVVVASFSSLRRGDSSVTRYLHIFWFDDSFWHFVKLLWSSCVLQKIQGKETELWPLQTYVIAKIFSGGYRTRMKIWSDENEKSVGKFRTVYIVNFSTKECWNPQNLFYIIYEWPLADIAQHLQDFLDGLSPIHIFLIGFTRTLY